ncbi:hypothetical protein [Candidatus Electronema sp. PJ]|uniref:hypothetical protein n=1 Tax=Candidatus Electronema sp. PJ TaxID=3401572 RepID=UPI003AA80CAE
MEKKFLALKPYLEKIRSHCDGLDKFELLDLLCQTAQEISAEERSDFLAKLGIMPTGKGGGRGTRSQNKDILARTESLLEDIIALHESVDDGSYYEEHCEEDYDDEFFGISEKQKQRLEHLLADADSLFLAGELDIAQQVYEKLTELILHGEGLLYSVNLDEIEVNWRETLARYCRCVYETSPNEKRAKRMRLALGIDRQIFSNSVDISEDILPSLRDVFDARAGEMAGWDDFLKQLQKNLSKAVSSRGILLHLEAVQWLDGLPGLAKEVRKKQAPVGYLFWLEQLRANEAWGELAQAAQEALQAMPLDSLRAQAANQLCLAGERVSDTGLVMLGKREQFFSQPNDRHLSGLLQEALRQKVVELELRRVLNFLATRPLKERSVGDKMLELKTLLLLGKLDEVYGKISKKVAIGWSGEEQPSGAVYAAILLVLSKGNLSAATIHALFNRYTCGRSGSDVFLCEEMKKSLVKISYTTFQEQNWLLFVERITANRVEHIVSNKYRKGYTRAAEALCGYMECLKLHGQQDKAAAFLSSHRDEKYKRYPAFRQEVDTVIKNSPLLAKMRE